MILPPNFRVRCGLPVTNAKVMPPWGSGYNIYVIWLDHRRFAYRPGWAWSGRSPDTRSATSSAHSATRRRCSTPTRSRGQPCNRLAQDRRSSDCPVETLHFDSTHLSPPQEAPSAGGRATSLKQCEARRGHFSDYRLAATLAGYSPADHAEAMPDAGAAGEGKRAEHGAKRRRERGRTARGSRRGAAPGDDDGNERAAPPAPDFDPGAHRHGPLSRRGSDLHDRDAERHRLLGQVVGDAGTGRCGRGGPSPASITVEIRAPPGKGKRRPRAS